MNGGMRKLGEYLEEKKECFLIWRRTRNEEDLDEYRRIKSAIKRMVREEERTLSIAENVKRIRKKFERE